ncbi:MAG: hypothetical protein ONB14_12595, partial [candidate division KSB1 bacterium]|nr:hypothetical protein [candidate division KSB1 bacterium]
MSDASGNTSWIYDDRGRVTQKVKVVNGTGGGTFKTAWSYRADDQVASVQYPGNNLGSLGEIVTTTYNPMGLVNTVSGSESYVQSTDYDALGRVELRKLGNDVLRVDPVYYPWTQANGQGRLQQTKTGTAANPTVLQDFSYTYDAAGNVQSIQDTKASGGTQTQSFTYDFLDRLLSATVTGGSTGQGQYSESYSYDTLGNVLTKGGLSYVYSTSQRHAVDYTYLPPYYTQGDYGYDANGNMTSRWINGTSYTLTYNEENRLTGVSGAATASFVYDADGKRV